MDPEYFSQLKKAHGIALSLLDIERNDLEHRWDLCDREVQIADADVINDQQNVNSLHIKRESILAELGTVIKHSKKESRNIQIQIKKLKQLAFEADEEVERLDVKLKDFSHALEETKERYVTVCKRRLGPEKI